MREILERLVAGTEAALINLDQSKAFDRVDHRFLATVLETVGFQPEFCKWISLMYHHPQAVVQVNEKRSEAFAIKRSGRVAHCILFSMSSLWKPCSVGIKTRRQVWPYAAFILLVFFRHMYLRTPMISLSLCSDVWTLKLWRRGLRGTSR